MKEFPTKDDAQHWLDVLKSLNNKKLLRGQFDLLKSASANRKATQEVYEKILASKQVFVPEDNPAYIQKPTEGKDIFNDLFPKDQPKQEPDLPLSTVRVPHTCLDKMKLLGSEGPVIGELWGWQHKTLGWRATTIITHDGQEDFSELPTASDMLTHLGFIRCGMGTGDPELTPEDKVKMQSIAGDQPVIAIVVSYPASCL